MFKINMNYIKAYIYQINTIKLFQTLATCFGESPTLTCKYIFYARNLGKSLLNNKRMLLSLRNDHKEHLAILTTQSTQVVVDFCKLAIDFLQNGPNLKLYNTASLKLEVQSEVIQNAVFGLINLLLESCKHNLNDVDFRDSILSLGFSAEQQIVLTKFYESKKTEFVKFLSESTVKVPHYYDLDWRLEIQVASRCLLQQVTPLITMNLCLETQSDIKIPEYEGIKQNIVLQTDPVNLVHMTQVLEQALNESRSRHIRRIQKTFK